MIDSYEDQYKKRNQNKWIDKMHPIGDLKKKKCLNSYGSKSSSGLLEMEKEYTGQLVPETYEVGNKTS